MPASFKRLGIHTVMRGTCGVDDQGFGITDIGQMGNQFQTINKTLAGLTATFNTKTEDCTAAFWQQDFCQFMIGMPG